MHQNIFLTKGDITKMQVDAIVNAANSSLMGGGGVDGAIHRAGGPEILEECRKIVAKQGSCKTGEAVITSAGKLPSKYVIHTVGPVWNGGKNDEAAKLASCYRNSLSLALRHDVESIAFPNISTGIYHYPKYEAASLAIQTVKEWLDEAKATIAAHFVCFDEENYQLYQDLLKA
ncbi:MAG: O-acetyl-ADP-ribose deacetylase [Citrobacter freundii]|nr:MAG: O-acetyl-ADP-ribose deacetylase [Citrobacter freundii]